MAEQMFKGNVSIVLANLLTDLAATAVSIVVRPACFVTEDH